MAATPADVSALQDLFPHHSKPQLLAALQQQGTFEAALDLLLTTPPECQTPSSNGVTNGAAAMAARSHTPPAGAPRRPGPKVRQQPLPAHYTCSRLPCSCGGGGGITSTLRSVFISAASNKYTGHYVVNADWV
jgi:hypothetical protein